MNTKTVRINGEHFAPTIIPRVYIQVDTKKGLEAYRTFNEIYSKYPVGGRILDDINEMKSTQAEGIYYTQV
jgi:hypothetical protein